MKRLISSYDEEPYEMVRKQQLDLGEFLALILFDDVHYRTICKKLSSYYNYYKTHSLVKDFTIPRAEYDGKSGLVKLDYIVFLRYYNDEIEQEETREEEHYTNISFTIDTNLKQIIFWFPLFS